MLKTLRCLCPISGRFSQQVLSAVMSTFAQVFNPISGQMEWEVRSSDYDFYQEVARSDYGDMLHDQERNQKYYAALKGAIASLHSRGLKANVLDIGTGTGLLSMMAVASGADTVVACEAFKPMADCAERIIARNGMSEKIKLIKLRSTEIKIGRDMEARANILVTEVFDTELIGEGAIDIFRHAHRNLLEPGATVIPHFARIYAQVVESPLVAAFNKPKMLATLDGEVLLKTPTEIVNCPGSTSLHEVQLNQLPLDSFRTLTEPQEVFAFDLSGKTELENDRRHVVECKSLQTGTVQAVFMWWDLQMDDRGEILLSCAPFWAHPDFAALKSHASARKPLSNVIPWRDHWMQALYYLPQDVTVQQGQSFSLVAYHDALSLWFDVTTNIPEERTLSPPFCTCGFHVACSRTRIGQINDHQRNKKYLRLLEEIPAAAKVLAIGDGSLLGLATAKMANWTYYLNFNYFSEKITKLYVTANGLHNVTIVNNVESIEKDLQAVTHVVAEPHFNTSILPWDNLFFFKFIKTRLADLLPADVTISPAKCDIEAVPVEFLDLHKIRKPLRNVENFNIEDFDKMLEKASALADSKFEAHPLWEYPCLALADPMKISSVDIESFPESSNTFTTTSKFKSSGSCNGVAFWVVWHLDRSGSDKLKISTGPRETIEPGKFIKWDTFTKQGVFFVVDPIPVTMEQPYQLDVKFSATAGPVECKLSPSLDDGGVVID
ncbi:protein arginine N-methyltransferase 7 [Lutzomyia longipalpis]|uniref:protein arginine N-methyltransferase 7 n=1 Tax=Lutzomyia longipalpis TaxID=7200 RepID=UPI00248353BE|nr:protein arginine N-methyltransferase 7 [Lutzomyia longipalpis]